MQVAGAALDIVYGQQVARGFGSVDQHAAWRAKALTATPPCRFEHFQVRTFCRSEFVRIELSW
jgi:hypothetical protein